MENWSVLYIKAGTGNGRVDEKRAVHVSERNPSRQERLINWILTRLQPDGRA